MTTSIFCKKTESAGWLLSTNCLLWASLGLMACGLNDTQEVQQQGSQEDDEGIAEPQMLTGAHLTCAQTGEATSPPQRELDFACQVNLSPEGASAGLRPDPGLVKAWWYVIDKQNELQSALAQAGVGLSSADIYCRADKNLSIGVMLTNTLGEVSNIKLAMSDITTVDANLAVPGEFADLSHWRPWKGVNVPSPGRLRGLDSEFTFYAPGQVVGNTKLTSSGYMDINDVCLDGEFTSKVRPGDFRFTFKNSNGKTASDSACSQLIPIAEQGVAYLYMAKDKCVNIFIKNPEQKIEHYVLPFPDLPQAKTFRKKFSDVSGYAHLSFADLSDILNWFACWRS